ncbi:MAG: hypothetical protein JNL63_06525 [Bacteroidia bacterium]|nr:hypothetical protein [Bacteroidia bacterium]
MSVHTNLFSQSVKERILTWSMIIPAAVMLIFFVMLFGCIGYTFDEYKVALMARTSGYWKGLKQIYYIGNFRYSGYFFNCLVFSFVKNSIYYPFTIMATYLALFVVWFKSIHTIVLFVFNKFTGLAVSKTIAAVLSIMFMVQLFFTTSQASEIFTCIGVTANYLTQVVFLMFFASRMLLLKPGYIEYILVVVCGIVIAGCAESFSLFVILLSVAFSVLFYVKFNISREHKLRLILFTVVLIIASVITYTAPGVRFRSEHDTVISNGVVPGNLLSYYVFTLRSLLSNLFPVRFWIGLLTFFPWLVVGAINSKQVELTNVLFGKLRNIFGVTFLTAILCFCFHIALTLFLFGNYGYMRIWFAVNFFIAESLCVLFFFIGLKAGVLVYRFFIFSYSLTCLVVSYFIIHIPKVLNYSHEYQKRITYLKANNTNFMGQVIVVKPLPESDILSVSEVSTDPEYDVNACFSDIHGLIYKVKLGQ